MVKNEISHKTSTFVCFSIKITKYKMAFSCILRMYQYRTVVEPSFGLLLLKKVNPSQFKKLRKKDKKIHFKKLRGRSFLVSWNLIKIIKEKKFLTGAMWLKTTRSRREGSSPKRNSLKNKTISKNLLLLNHGRNGELKLFAKETSHEYSLKEQTHPSYRCCNFFYRNSMPRSRTIKMRNEAERGTNLPDIFKRRDCEEEKYNVSEGAQRPV